MTRRVVITGVGLASPIGNDLNTVSKALRDGRHGIVAMPEWSRIGQLSSLLAGVVEGPDLSRLERKKVRTMGRVSLLSVYASNQAVADAGLSSEDLVSPRTGLAYGSTHGSTTETEEFCRRLFDQESLAGIPGSSFLKFMNHTCAANLAQYYGIRGRVVPTVSACTSASQAIGTAYEAVKYGIQDVMLAGGAEEMHFVHAAVFDLLYAASNHFNSDPGATPRPFDAQRDGLVVGEGAGTLVLETLEHATARGAHVYAELKGFGMSSDGTHVTSPNAGGMASAMRLALEDAAVHPREVDYINAHATATDVGDIAESIATQSVFGERIPVSSTKSLTGHTLGACGAIEAAFCLAMMRDGFIAANRNLEQLDERCARLDYVRGSARAVQLSTVMSNNFAFGGINTSMILRRL